MADRKTRRSSARRTRAKAVRSVRNAFVELNLEEAALRIRRTSINPLNVKDKSLMRDLRYLLASSKDGADYDSMAFRAVTLNVVNFQRAGRSFFYCATKQRMAICGRRTREIPWHAKGVVNDHTVPLHFQYLMLQKKQPKDIFAVYRLVRKWNFLLAVTKSQNENMPLSRMPSAWNGSDIFARARMSGIQTILLFPGKFKKLPANWQVSN